MSVAAEELAVEVTDVAADFESAAPLLLLLLLLSLSLEPVFVDAAESKLAVADVVDELEAATPLFFWLPLASSVVIASSGLELAIAEIATAVADVIEVTAAEVVATLL